MNARALIIAAHPDDESIGAVWLMRHLRDVHVVFVTDGAPFERSLWPSTLVHDTAPAAREAYAQQRIAEAERALALVDIGSDRVYQLGVPDQQASWQLLEITLAIEVLVCALHPGVLIVQPYEGGHPDHDAAAFCAHAALQRRIIAAHRRGAMSWRAPKLIEMASYHGAAGTLRTGRFLQHTTRTFEQRLSHDDRALKQGMFDCYASQSEVLAAFSTDRESYRYAPVYDFSKPPHPGELYFESLGGAMTGERWRELAYLASEQLGVVTSASAAWKRGALC